MRIIMREYGNISRQNTVHILSLSNTVTQNLAKLCAVLLGFSIPISTAGDSILLVLLLLTTLLGWHQHYFTLRFNPLAKASLVLLLILGLASFNGASSLLLNFQASWGRFTKYDDLLLPVLLLPIFATPALRRYGVYAFISAMILTLALSFLLKWGWHLPFLPERYPDNPTPFKLHITHGILMSFFSLLCACYALHNENKWRWLWMVLAMLSSYNVLVMTQGRTGYITLLALTVYWLTVMWQQKRYTMGLISLLIIVGFSLNSTFLTQRLGLGIAEIQQYQRQPHHNSESSMGARMTFYVTTAKIISHHPWLGVGLGGFTQAYLAEEPRANMAYTNNPHNQYLLFWASAGIAGLVAFLWLLWTAWYKASRLASAHDTMLARGMVITVAVGSMFNSMLLDHTEGLLFAWLLGLLFAGYQYERT